jgi:Tetraspanin family
MGWIIQFINVLFLVVGGGTVGVGIYSMVKLQSNELTELVSIYLPVGIIVLGVAVMIISILGCCGAHKRSKFLLTAYFIIVFIIVVAQLGVIIAMYVYRDKVPDTLEDAWDDTKADDQTSIMKAFKCCGWKNSTDVKSGAKCPENSSAKPCAKKIDDFVEDHLLTISIAGIVLLVVELLGLVFSLWMCCGIGAAVDHEETKALISDARRHRHEYQRAPKSYENKYAGDRFPNPIQTERVEEHHHHEASQKSQPSDWSF